jgi:hypothetical protein
MRMIRQLITAVAFSIGLITAVTAFYVALFYITAGGMILIQGLIS